MGDEIKIDPKRHVMATDIAKFLDTKVYGDDIQIKTVKQLDDAVENSLVFSTRKLKNTFLKNVEQTCFIISELPNLIENNVFIVVDNPRLAFAKILLEFFSEKKTPGIGKYSVIHRTAKIANSVIIGNCCSIGQNVEIADNTEIRNNVVIADGVKIGQNCLIRSNSVIGEEGFGFENEEDGTPIRIPHLGSVEIGDFVEIGNFTAIARGTLKNTIIHSHVKIDNLVHISHNCVIGKNSMIYALSSIRGVIPPETIVKLVQSHEMKKMRL